MVTKDQIKSALAALDWTNPEAAKKSGISVSTVQRIRLGRPVTESNRQRLVEALKGGGIEFGNDGWVRLK